MSAAEGGTWMLLSQVLARVPEDQRKEKQRALIERIASRAYRVRYSNSNELSTARMSHPDPHVQYKPPRDGKELHADFFRMGRVNWLFSMVTFGDRTIHQIEIFYPDPPPDRSEVEAAVDRSPGRPSPAGDLIRVEAERLLSEGAAFNGLAAFAREAHRRINGAAALGTVKNRVRDLWKRSSEDRLIK
jgi:hypothetical protein